MDETPLRITGTELPDRVPALTSGGIEQAVAARLIVPAGDGYFLVRSPALLALVAGGVRAGVPLDAMLDTIAAITRGIGELAEEVADHVVGQIAPALTTTGDVSPLQGPLQRWRVLLLQGAASILADRLGASLLAMTEGDPASEQLRAAIDRVRIGVVTDTDGTIRH
jgi:hypothetical protein